MKELFISFVIALVVGSFINGMNKDDSSDGSGGGAPAMDQTAQAGLELVPDIDEGSFQGYVLDSKEPVLVEFYTDTCPNCVSMKPVIGKLAYNGQGVLRLCKINAGKAASLAERYQVQGVPTFALFNEGHLLDQTSGAREYGEMNSWLAINNVTVPNSVAGQK